MVIVSVWQQSLWESRHTHLSPATSASTTWVGRGAFLKKNAQRGRSGISRSGKAHQSDHTSIQTLFRIHICIFLHTTQFVYIRFFSVNLDLEGRGVLGLASRCRKRRFLFHFFAEDSETIPRNTQTPFSLSPSDLLLKYYDSTLHSFFLIHSVRPRCFC